MPCLHNGLLCSMVRGSPKYPPIWGSSLFYDAPARQLQPSKCKFTPSSKMYTGEGRFQCHSIQSLQIGGHQFAFWWVSIYILEGTNVHFGGHQFTFWRLTLFYGCFKEKGGPPTRVPKAMARSVPDSTYGVLSSLTLTSSKSGRHYCRGPESEILHSGFERASKNSTYPVVLSVLSRNMRSKMAVLTNAPMSFWRLGLQRTI